MSDIKINNVTNRNGDTGPIIAGVSTVSSSAFMVMPSGDTAIRGAGSGRGVFGGGLAPSNINILGFITIASTGNAQDFGDLSSARRFPAALASSTRGLFGSGLNDTIIDYVTISSSGGANDFGDKKRTGFSGSGLSNNIRGIFAGGYHPSGAIFRKTMEFVTIATKSDANDFGELSQGGCHIGACASPTRGILMGASVSESPTIVNTIEFITIATTGDAQDFGDLSLSREVGNSNSDSHGGLGGY